MQSQKREKNMANTISTAKYYSGTFRFSGDHEFISTNDSIESFHDVRNLLYSHELMVSQHVTPGLENSLGQVCNRLRLPRSAFDAFVYSSADIQASCIARDAENFSIRFSSGLVDLLDENEFKFVVGHEIAHFLFGHQLALANISSSIEQYLLQRAQEISADRVGLISCNSLDVAARTLMKSLSGLSSRHLRFDVREFVDQIRHTAPNSATGNIVATHPSMMVRCRALLWFSASNLISCDLDLVSGDRSEKEKLDRRVETDLDKFVNGPARQEIERAKSDLGLWMAAAKVVKKSRYSKADQQLILETFGEQTANSLKAFLSDIDPTVLDSTVYEKLLMARTALSQIIPLSFLKEYQRLESQIDKLFPG